MGRGPGWQAAHAIQLRPALVLHEGKGSTPPAGRTARRQAGEAKLLKLLEEVKFQRPARVAKLADAWDLKSLEAQASCGFESHPEHWRVNDSPPSAGIRPVGVLSFSPANAIRRGSSARVSVDPPASRPRYDPSWRRMIGA